MQTQDQPIAAAQPLKTGLRHQLSPHHAALDRLGNTPEAVLWRLLQPLPIPAQKVVIATAAEWRI